MVKMYKRWRAYKLLKKAVREHNPPQAWSEERVQEHVKRFRKQIAQLRAITYINGSGI